MQLPYVMPDNRRDDVYFTVLPPLAFYNPLWSGDTGIGCGSGEWVNAEWAMFNKNFGAGLFTDIDMNERWPAMVKADPARKMNPANHAMTKAMDANGKPVYRIMDNPSLGTMSGSIFISATAYKPRDIATLFGGYKKYARMVRPGLKRISPEWLNRLAANAMNKATGRTLNFQPPYFSFTYTMARNNYTFTEQLSGTANWVAFGQLPRVIGVTKKVEPLVSGSLFDVSEIDALDPWKKMFKGIEHQVFLYGDGDAVAPNASGQYKWPFGMTMPIAPTVGNIYMHFLQVYLSTLAKEIGSVGLADAAWNSLDTNVSFATVYPESANAAQVAIGNYIVYAGHGITYGHPEGPYAAKMMLPDNGGSLSDPQVLGMAKDVAAYANRERIKWIAANQTIYAKARDLAAAGADVYTLNISELTAVNVVVTDANGVVVGTGGTTEITGGSGSGAIVTQTPTTGQVIAVTDVTPGAANPLQIATVQVTSGATTVTPGSGSSVLAPIVSVARDTSPRLVTAQRAYADAKEAGATDAQAEQAAAGVVTTPPKKGSLVPIATILTILSMLN